MTAKIPNPTDLHIGRRLKQRRLELEKSQTDLGESVGITFQQIQKYEKGYNRIGGSRMAQLGQILGVDPGWFYIGAPVTFETAKPGEPMIQDVGTMMLATRDGLRLAKAFTQITSEAVKRRLVDLAETMVEEHAAVARGS